MISFGCCVGEWDKLNTFVRPHVGDRPLYCVFGATSIATAYNKILDFYRDRTFDALVLQHDDLELIDPEGDQKFLDALADPEVALVGVAGARTVDSLAWWEGDTVGHQYINTGLIDFGPRTGDVTALEGSVIVLSPWAVRHLRFDTTYAGFHGYDCDVAMSARARGRRVRVVDVDTHHHVTLGFKSCESAEAWNAADQVFRAKWCDATP